MLNPNQVEGGDMAVVLIEKGFLKLVIMFMLKRLIQALCIDIVNCELEPPFWTMASVSSQPCLSMAIMPPRSLNEGSYWYVHFASAISCERMTAENMHSDNLESLIKGFIDCTG